MSNRMLRMFVLVLVWVGVSLGGFCDATRAKADEPLSYDVVVYGSTSAGVIAAVQASRENRSVILVHPYRHIGGLTSSGLGNTDHGRKGTIGGLSREFYKHVRDYYRVPERWRQQTRESYFGRYLQRDDDLQWAFEPHVAEEIYRDWLEERHVPILKARLDRTEGKGVQMRDQRIRAIVMESGQVIRGSMFIDATYEGDLMAAAGVSYFVGREGNDRYGETYNGIQTARTEHHVFTVDGRMGIPPRPLPPEARVDPYVVAGDPSSGLLPGINPDAGGQDGEADHRVQSYCYRLCLTDDPENMVPFAPPEGYDPLDYELLFRMFEAGEPRIPWLPGHMPNRKTDTNNRWAVSMNLIGGSGEYPEASYERRREIEKEHEHWQRGLMWTLANHPRVPEHVRNEVSRWGYAADEFVDNDHWPFMIYIRVARRMVSDYVMTEHDCQLRRIASDSVGMGSYTMDSHNVQRYVTPEGYVQNEGNIERPAAGPYSISYRTIIPARGEAENLLVTCAVSASHIAYGSIRMEPVFMILGQSAASAAAIALEDDVSVQDVDYDKLHQRLVEDGQVLSLTLGISISELEGIVVDHSQAETQGEWMFGNVIKPFVARGYLHDDDSSKGQLAVRFTTDLPRPGRYEVRVSYSAHANRASNVPVAIQTERGLVTAMVDQRQTAPIDELWISLGTFPFDRQAQIEITNTDTNGHVIVDAVQFIPVDD